MSPNWTKPTRVGLMQHLNNYIRTKKMRKVTEQITEAFLNGRKLTVGNSMTDGNSIFLHGNKIAWRDEGELFISMCGWGTPTTRERLNGLLRTINADVRIHQRNYEQLLVNDKTKVQIPMIQSNADVIVRVEV